MSGPSPQPTPPSGALIGVVPGDVGALAAKDLGAAYRDVSALVTWLREQGRKVPAVDRLLPLLHWRSALCSSNWNLEKWP